MPSPKVGAFGQIIRHWEINGHVLVPGSYMKKSVSDTSFPEYAVLNHSSYDPMAAELIELMFLDGCHSPHYLPLNKYPSTSHKILEITQNCHKISTSRNWVKIWLFPPNVADF